MPIKGENLSPLYVIYVHATLTNHLFRDVSSSSPLENQINPLQPFQHYKQPSFFTFFIHRRNRNFIKRKRLFPEF